MGCLAIPTVERGLAIGMGAIPPPAPRTGNPRNNRQSRWFPERRPVAGRIGLAARAPPVPVTILVSAAAAGVQAYRPACAETCSVMMSMKVEGLQAPWPDGPPRG